MLLMFLPLCPARLETPFQPGLLDGLASQLLPSATCGAILGMRKASVVIAFGLFLIAPTLSANSRKSLHTSFLFAHSGAKSYWTETQGAPRQLGTFQGWSCEGSAIRLEEGNDTDAGSPYNSKSAKIRCVNAQLTEAEIMVSCGTQAPDRSRGFVHLSNKDDAVGARVTIECVTVLR